MNLRLKLPISIIRLSSASALLLAIFMLPSFAFAQEDDKSGVSPQVISLPSGPGSLEGLGESFEPDLSTGTASYPYPLTLPPGVNGFAPQMSLLYNGGNPNGPYGVGWRLNTQYIQRKTDEGIPDYNMDDRFVFHTGEELIPVGGNYYRFENESDFFRFQWLPETGSWLAQSPEGLAYEFGPATSSQINITVDGQKEIFRWYLKKITDVNGNVIEYFYINMDAGSNIYLSEIRYNYSNDNRFNSIKIRYEKRQDIFEDRQSRGPISYAFRASHIDIYALGNFVRRYEFDYRFDLNSELPFSLLNKITVTGEDGISQLPSTTFEYTAFDPNGYAVVDMRNVPFVSLSDPNSSLIDMTYDGLPDLVYTPSQFDQILYTNKGNGEWSTDVSRGVAVAQLESPSVKFADMDGNGQVDLLEQVAGTELSFYSTEPGQLWDVSQLVSYEDWLFPYFDLANPNLQLVDLNNDKLIDIYELGEDQFKVWLAPEDNKWSFSPDYIIDPLEAGLPRDVSTLRFGDMTGDRLQDLVVIRDSYISYFPHDGGGNYAVEHIPKNAPIWLTPAEMETLLLGDINNDGLDDLIQPRSGQVRYWLNYGNNGFSELYTVPAEGDTTTILPEFVAESTSIQLADMNGDGSTDLVYGQPDGRIQYLDFNVGSQPNLITAIDNGLGRTYQIQYEPSTTFYVDALDTESAWETTIPFPVQVVSQLAILDANSGAEYKTTFDYRDGYYDGDQKEFRGFAEVIKTEHGDSTAPTTVSIFTYDTGQEVESQKGLLLGEVVTGEGGSCIAPVSECYYRTESLPSSIEISSTEQGVVSYSYIKQTDRFIHENQDDPIQLRETTTQDQFGNIVETFNFGRICGEDLTCGDDERLQYVEYALNIDNWLLRFPSREWQTDENGAFVSEHINYYDGEDYIGLSQGEIEKGLLKRQSNNLGPLENNRFVNSLRHAFDSYGNVVGIKDANGNLSTIAYDHLVHTFPMAEYIHLENGRMLSVVANYHFGFGQITSATDFNGNASLYKYDAFGRLSKIALPGDSLELPTQEFVYDLGSPRSSIMIIEREKSGEEAVRRSIIYYDGLGRALQARRDAEDGKVAVENAMFFNARQSESLNYLPYFDETFEYALPHPALPHSAKIYDSQSRVVKTVNPDGTFVSANYLPLQQQQFDEEDNRAESPHFGTPKTLIYDGLERLIGVDEWNRTDGIDEIYSTRYGYDLLDNVTTFVDAQGNIKTMTFDGLSRKLFMDDPNRGEMIYVYDDFGNVVQTTDAKSQTIVYEYDSANRLGAEQWVQPDGSFHTYAKFYYDYDLSPRHPEAQNTLGQITYIEDDAGIAYFSYDARGNMAGESRYFVDEDLEFITLMSYDATDRLSTLTYPDGSTIEYVYNAQGLLENIPGFIDNIDYIASGQHDTMAYSNGVLRDYNYDSRLRLEHLKSTNSTQALQDLTYTFDGNSNIINITDGRPNKIAENDQSQTYEYDSLYRLTQASGTYGEINYTYDSLANMTSKTSTADDERLNIGAMLYGENGAGPYALTKAGNEIRQYDANGNLADSDSINHSWDYRNQLTHVENLQLLDSSSFTYDFKGIRAIKSIEGNSSNISTTLYINRYSELRDGNLLSYVFVDADRVTQNSTEFDANILIKTFDDQAPGRSIDTRDSLWYLADHLGGTSLLTDSSGEQDAETVYYPYGLIRFEQNGKKINYGFTGKELDSTGLQYFEARYYDPTTGKFISVDPYYVSFPQDEIGQIVGFNLYSYANNNPLKYIDPTGLKGGTKKPTGRAKLRLASDLTTFGSAMFRLISTGGLSGPADAVIAIKAAGDAAVNAVGTYQEEVLGKQASNTSLLDAGASVLVQVGVVSKENEQLAHDIAAGADSAFGFATLATGLPASNMDIALNAADQTLIVADTAEAHTNTPSESSSCECSQAP